VRTVNNVSSVGIIFRASDPSQVFLEVKDDGHPIALVRRQLCLIGGNWIGDSAKADKGPLDTFRREVEEELTFDRPTRDTLELRQLGQVAESSVMAPTPRNAVSVSESDQAKLRALKDTVKARAEFFAAGLNGLTKEAMDAVDPNNRRESFIGISFYWAVALSEEEWADLTALQEAHGNLSNESITLVTSLAEICDSGVKGAFGHEAMLQRFFRSRDLSRAEDLPMGHGLQAEFIGNAPMTYAELLQQWNILRHP